MEKPNYSYINELSRGDEAFKNKLLDVVKNEFPGERDIFLKNFETRNFEQAAANVHKLKFKISILGLVESYTVAEKFEEGLKENSIEGHEEFEQILKTITDFLETI
ncbi:MAG: Hpt domain-containing protein [Jejuia sp.]